MQVATLFRETAKLLGASMDGSVMDNSKYCMKPETQADDGYETCLDAMCGPHAERLMGGAQHMFDPSMRHPGMDSRGQGRPVMHSMKMDQYGGDPYSFVDEMPNNMEYNTCNNNINTIPPPHPTSAVKKRGRRKKSDSARNPEFREQINPGREEKIMDAKERKRHDRFNGLSEEEVSRRTLPDHLASNLDVVIVGINPGMFAAFKGHHYAGPGNHFWKCLYLSGLVPEPLTAEDDFSLLNYGIGFTNMVARPTKGSADLTRREIKQGSQILLEKLQKFRPKIAVFNGKLIYEVFSGKKDFPFGRQSEFVDGTNTYIWVMPSSSARCAQLPRAADKVPFYMALKKFRDYLNGLISEIDESEVVFHEPKPSAKAAAAAAAAASASANGEMESKSVAVSHSGPAGFTNGTAGGEGDGGVNPGKKKRGRPRKGMEKGGGGGGGEDSKKAKFHKNSVSREEKEGEGAMGKGGGRMGEPQRKRRGRPKKVKPEGNSPSLGSHTPEALGDRGISSGIGTCQTQKASSVSSGYSTGTAGSSSSNEERCRRDENGSLSNAGSSGLSPSHHSFTTQSDLSSEISAAISCGSGPPSPLNNGGPLGPPLPTNNNVNSNNQTESVFEGLSVPPPGVSREELLSHHSQSKLPNIHQIQRSSHGQSPTCNPPMYPNGGEGRESHDQSYAQQYGPPYDNRFHHVSSNRSQSYGSASVREEGDSSMQSNPNSSTTYHNSSYETKCLDITSKSLSGLESLVDQIPSIGEAEGGGGGVGGGGSSNQGGGPQADPQQQQHPQSLSTLHSPNLGGPMGGGGGYGGEAAGGFLPYAHHSAPSSYAAASHYASSPYYASDLSASFPVNSLSSYGGSAGASGMMFGYPGYHHGQYGANSGGAGYGSPNGGPPLHLPPSAYGNPAAAYSSAAYSGPNPYMQGHPMSSSSHGQRYPQRSFHHLRQDNMDLGPLGFGGF